MESGMWVGALLVLAGCSGDQPAGDGGTDATKPDTSAQDTGTGMDTGTDTGTGTDSGGDAAGMDGGGTDGGGDAAADSGNTCWMGSKDQCATCCTSQNPGGAQSWANLAGNCMCANNVCGMNNQCGNSICQGMMYNAGCQTCLQTKFTANGPCANQYTVCQAAALCKAWAACMLGCP